MSSSDAAAHPARPDQMFNREAEWDALARFVCDERPGATLGLVSGQRRHGKTYLLEAMIKATGGFYFDGQAAAQAESLRRLADRLAAYTGAPQPPDWRRWEEAVDALLALGDERPAPAVIDNFPDLVGQSPALPAVIHSAYRRLHKERPHNRARLILSGGSPSIVTRLFSGPSSLHDLATLELVVRPFDFRKAARFWGIDDPRLAVQVHAVVGGTPAYRGDFVCDDAPAGPDDFDAWLCRTALNPRVPLFWEARHLLEEEADHADRALCHSALVAIASGCSTRGEITECVEGSLNDVSHVLAVMENRHLLYGEPDAFRPGLTHYRIAEPLLAFEHAVAWPNRVSLEQEDVAEVWRRARSGFDSAVVAPHFAQLCRNWVMEYAASDTYGGVPEAAVCGTVPDPARHARLDADVAVRGMTDGRPGVLLSIGLARWDETMDLRHLDRLRHIRTVLAASGEDTGQTLPACYSATGFTPELRAAAGEGEVLLVGLERLYGGE
ncbi:AAA family ATPase [Streptomyces halobius]|uniref:ArsR family transcriptional regulator n=1 Tax=Streptomyces halobius TaxID=2879846 RepID=A0ABY4MAP4_9ACTN|nr:ArsR family transcriptional regulator [Streptomyces halobius]UQA94412.1 ArsR family transcriptional regulator [Streptomyces halobius]